MHYNARVCAAVIGGSALVALGALSIAVAGGRHTPQSADGSTQMTLGSTSTATTATTTLGAGEAAPTIKGPAPLPTEEQGLEGIEGRHR
jgi:hypothetical protein